MLFFVNFRVSTEGGTARPRIALGKDIKFHGANSLLELSVIVCYENGLSRFNRLGLGKRNTSSPSSEK